MQDLVPSTVLPLALAIEQMEDVFLLGISISFLNKLWVSLVLVVFCFFVGFFFFGCLFRGLFLVVVVVFWLFSILFCFVEEAQTIRDLTSF